MSYSKYKESAQGLVYHLYNRGNQKQDIFLDDFDYTLYISRLEKYCTQFSFEIIAYCLMPNHVHLLLKQDGLVPPAKLMSSLHTSYAMIFNKKYGKVGHLFQDRYKQKVVPADAYLYQLINYIHLNPVKEKFVSDPTEYPWSNCKGLSFETTIQEEFE